MVQGFVQIAVFFAIVIAAAPFLGRYMARMTYLSQMAGLAVENFLSAAVGIAALVALVRGLVPVPDLAYGKSVFGGVGDRPLRIAALRPARRLPRRAHGRPHARVPRQR